jgi:predicted acetyltransferase
MASPLKLRAIESDKEAAELAAISSWGFASSEADALAWVKASLEQARVVVSGRRVVGGLMLVPMGQWFGGRSVPVVGIAGVSVSPEQRGHGVGSLLMRATLLELAERGVALSALYPASPAFYRSWGYESAGSRFSFEVAPRNLPQFDPELSIRPIADADAASIENAYARQARTLPGYLDRGAYIWGRVRAPRREPARGFLAIAGESIEGYLYLSQRHSVGAHYDLGASDVVALTPRAARRLITFLADHRPLADRVVWHGGLADALLPHLPERVFQAKLADLFMLRIVDVPAAIGARGFPAGLEAELAIEVRDPLFSRESRRFTIAISGGNGRAEPATKTDLRLDVRGLAALYSGYLSAESLEKAGLAEGHERALAAATSIFGGPAPGMSDMF